MCVGRWGKMCVYMYRCALAAKQRSKCYESNKTDQNSSSKKVLKKSYRLPLTFWEVHWTHLCVRKSAIKIPLLLKSILLLPSFPDPKTAATSSLAFFQACSWASIKASVQNVICINKSRNYDQWRNLKRFLHQIKTRNKIHYIVITETILFWAICLCW